MPFQQQIDQIFSKDAQKQLYIMGVLNATPDSFSDGGRYDSARAAVEAAKKMFADGAAIVDVGGESTKPGAKPVSLEEELDRVIPVIKELSQQSPGIISVDTSKPEVARQAIESGAHIVNDVTGLANPQMVEVCAALKVPVIICHMKGTPANMQANPTYSSVNDEVSLFLLEQAKIAEAAGIRQIMVDPGIGFGKTLEHNLSLIKNIAGTAEQSYPVLLGASRKAFIGKLAGVEEAQERDPGTIASTIFAREHGVRVVRVHNVAANAQALKVWDALN